MKTFGQVIDAKGTSAFKDVVPMKMSQRTLMMILMMMWQIKVELLNFFLVIVHLAILTFTELKMSQEKATRSLKIRLLLSF